MNAYLHIVILMVCFYDCIIMLLLPSSATLIVGTDGSTARMICHCAAIGVAMAALLTTGFKKLPNIWMGLLLGFIVFSSFHSPAIHFDSTFTPKDAGLFNFKPMFECIVYFCLFMGIYSLSLTDNDVKRICKSLAWVGIIYSGYIVLQHFGIDQLYRLTNEQELSSMSRNPMDGGFISQPVFAAALLTICYGFVLKYYPKMTPLILAAVFLTGNRSALAATAILSLYILIGSRKYVLAGLLLYIGTVAFAMAIYFTHHWQLPLLNDSGRFDMWQMVIKDFIHPIFPGVGKSYILTGLGLGSFSVLFPFYHHSGFYQAHNECLEILYTLSIGGLFLFFKMVQHIFKTVVNDGLFMALTGVSICSLTNAVWHIPQLQFLTVVLIALAYNKESHYGLGTINTQ